MVPPKTITFFKEHTDLEDLAVAPLKFFLFRFNSFDSPKNEKSDPLNKMTTSLEIIRTLNNGPT